MEQPSTIPAMLLPMQEPKEASAVKAESALPKIVFWCALGAIAILAARFFLR